MFDKLRRGGRWSVALLLTVVGLCMTIGEERAHSMGAITGSTTWGTTLEEHSGDQLRLEDLIGKAKWDYSHVQLDGMNNRIAINVSAIALECDLDTGKGQIAGDLGVASFGIRSQGFAFWERRYVFIRGSLGGYEIELRLDYQPGMGAITSASPKENVSPTRCQVLIREPEGDEWAVYDGYPGE